MFLVQLLLPANEREDRSRPLLMQIRRELTDRFGGLTAYSRAPAEGLWKPEAEGPVSKDALVVYEVMVVEVNRTWWADYRTRLEELFKQQEIVVRMWEMERL